MHITRQHRTSAVILGDQRIAVINALGLPRPMPHVRAGLCDAEHRAEQRGQDGPSRRSGATANAPQLSMCPRNCSFDIIGVGRAAIRRKIAVGVMGEACAAHACILVEAVGSEDIVSYEFI
jgi:hypothetical protein